MHKLLLPSCCLLINFSCNNSSTVFPKHLKVMLHGVASVACPNITGPSSTLKHKRLVDSSGWLLSAKQSLTCLTRQPSTHACHDNSGMFAYSSVSPGNGLLGHLTRDTSATWRQCCTDDRRGMSMESKDQKAAKQARSKAEGA